MSQIEVEHSDLSPSTWRVLKTPHKGSEMEVGKSTVENRNESMSGLIKVISSKDKSELQRLCIETSKGNKSVITLEVPSSDSHGWIFGRGSVTFADLNEKRVKICDPTVSGKHFRLFRSEELNGRLMVCDLGSLHGTKLNGVLLKSHESFPVKPGDTMVIGASKVKFLESENSFNNGSKWGIEGKENIDDDSAMLPPLACPICIKDLSYATPGERAAHILECSAGNKQDVQMENFGKRTKVSKSCPVCNKDITSMELDDQLVHVNSCLNITVSDAEKTTTVSPLNLPILGSSSKANPGSEAVDLCSSPSLKPIRSLFYTKKVKISCPLCGKDLSNLSITQQQGHANRCADKLNPKTKKMVQEKAKSALKRLEENGITKQNNERASVSPKIFENYEGEGVEHASMTTSKTNPKCKGFKSIVQEERFIFNKCVSSVVVDEECDLCSDDEVFIKEPTLLARKHELESEARKLHSMNECQRGTLQELEKQTSEHQRQARIAHFHARSSESVKFPSPFRPAVPVSRELLVRRKAYLQAQLQFVDEILAIMPEDSSSEMGNSSSSTTGSGNEKDCESSNKESSELTGPSNIWAKDKNADVNECNISKLLVNSHGEEVRQVREQAEMETHSFEKAKVSEFLTFRS